jgi:voltage-gated potassium channel
MGSYFFNEEVEMEVKNRRRIDRPTDDMPYAKLKTTQRSRIIRFFKIIGTRTPFLKMIVTLIILWLLFSTGIYLAEQGMEGTTLDSYGRALYWGIAAFSTAGIADAPLAGTSQVIGGIWIVVGSVLFFGTIVATVTAYFMRHLQHPVRQIIDTIEYNLEQIDELSVDELDLLKKTTDCLIIHLERLKKRS